MSEQMVVKASKDYKEIDNYLKDNGIKSLFLVCGSSIKRLDINCYIESLEEKGIRVVRFSDYEPNPKYESVVKGVSLFNKEQCDAIMAIGGGSAMDVAKCIKLYSNMDESRCYLEQEIVPNSIKFLAVPTTAGTGSEATRYAVIYYKGEKQSVSHTSCIPDFVLLDATTLETLPLYHKKATMMDAMCHAVEAFWSVNSTEESKVYSKEAIGLILANKDKYLANDKEGNTNMLMASNLAGKAINITQTTAGHAMCYKLTSLYGIAHGHAAALCVKELFPYMCANTDKCADARGKEYLDSMFVELAEILGAEDMAQKSEAVVDIFAELVDSLEFESVVPKAEDYEVLKSSVNPVRLKNNPVALTEDVIDALYHNILG